MNSSKILNYETRPLKFTERKMLLACLQKICNYFGDNYQYVGFGGLSYPDFKLFHKELHISNMFSIEGGDITLERLKYNSPYSFIEIKKSISTTALNEIDLSKKTLVWMDYDDVLNPIMFEDINVLFSQLPIGSIYIFTCNRQLKDYSLETFKDIFEPVLPFILQEKNLSTDASYKTINSMLSNTINSILKDRNIVEDEQLIFNQLFNIVYQENRGAKMYTYGGLLTNSDMDVNSLGLEAFNFVSIDDKKFEIEIPNLTRKEFQLIDSYLFLKEDELINKNIVTKEDIELYKKSYKYVPYFYDIRI